MKIKINGEPETINQDTLTVSELLVFKDVKMPDMVSVEYNGEMLDREKFDTTQLKENDEVEFLYFMGGGNVGI
jgi:sulfur carrier protein